MNAINIDIYVHLYVCVVCQLESSKESIDTVFTLQHKIL